MGNFNIKEKQQNSKTDMNTPAISSSDIIYNEIGESIHEYLASALYNDGYFIGYSFVFENGVAELSMGLDFMMFNAINIEKTKTWQHVQEKEYPSEFYNHKGLQFDYSNGKSKMKCIHTPKKEDFQKFGMPHHHSSIIEKIYELEKECFVEKYEYYFFIPEELLLK